MIDRLSCQIPKIRKTPFTTVLFFLSSLILVSFSSAASAVILKPKATAWIRLATSISQMKTSPSGKFIAFVPKKSKGLSVMNLKTRKVYQVSHEQVGPSFFWTPDGGRVVFREVGKSTSQKIESIVKIFDTKLKKSIITDRYNHNTGFLTFDPKDLRFLLMHNKGIHAKRLQFPNSRLARWQIAQRQNPGHWVASQNGILWVSQGGLMMRKIKDDGSSVESFDISPDGQSIAWATKDERVYTSHSGKKSVFIGHGKDPDWHPERHLLVYSGSRRLGNKTIGHDVKIIDQSGRSRWLTQSQHSSERWPQWLPEKNSIIYTKEKTTDLYTLELKL